MCSQRKAQFYAGVIVMGLALVVSVFLSDHQYFAMTFTLILQVMATGALFFSLLNEHSVHKPKFLLFWLGVTAIFLTCLLYAILDHIKNTNYYGKKPLVIGAISVVVIVYMMNIIYKGYVELTKDPVETVHAVETLETVQTVAEDKPPTYEISMNNASIPLNT